MRAKQHLILIVVLFTHLDLSRCEKLHRILPAMEPGETTLHFLHRVILPDQQYLDMCDLTIKTITEILKENGGPLKHKGWPVTDVRKIGSLVKETAVRNMSDVDLTVSFDGFTDAGDLNRHIGEVLDAVKDVLSTKFPGDLVFIAILPMAIITSISVSGENKHELDLVPAVDMLTMGYSPESVFQAMAEDPDSRYTYQASLKPLNHQFVLGTPGNVKDVIRLVKYWKMIKHLPIRSCVVELIVIWIWREDGRPEVVELYGYFIKALQQLAELDAVRISFNDYFNITDYQPDITPPFVVDPSNPFTNYLPDQIAREVIKQNANFALDILEVDRDYTQITSPGA